MAQPIYGCLLFLSVACGTFSEAGQKEQRKSTRMKKKSLQTQSELFCDGRMLHKLFVSHPTRTTSEKRIHLKQNDLRSLILIIKQTETFVLVTLIRVLSFTHN